MKKVLIFIISFALFSTLFTMEFSDKDELWKRYEKLREEMLYTTEYICIDNIGQLNREFSEHVEQGNIAMVQCLLALGADCNVKADMGYKAPFFLLPITAAARLGNEELCTVLMNVGANINAQEDKDCGGKKRIHYNALWYAVYNGHLNIVKLLFKHGMQKPENDTLFLPRLSSIEMHKNYFEMRELLKEHGIALSMRSEWGQYRVDSDLVDHVNRYVFDWAKRAIMQGANVNFYNETWGSALIQAAKLKYGSGKKFVKLLLEYGADPNIIDSGKWTPLMHAVAEENVNKKLCTLLLDYGANQRWQSKDGYTALMIAASRRNKGTCLRLVEHQEKEEKRAVTCILCLKYHESESGKTLYQHRKTILRSYFEYFTLKALLILKNNEDKIAYDYWQKKWLKPW